MVHEKQLFIFLGLDEERKDPDAKDDSKDEEFANLSVEEWWEDLPSGTVGEDSEDEVDARNDEL